MILKYQIYKRNVLDSNMNDLNDMQNTLSFITWSHEVVRKVFFTVLLLQDESPMSHNTYVVILQEISHSQFCMTLYDKKRYCASHS